MAASTRSDFVAVSFAPEVGVPRSVEEPAVSMITRKDRRVRTGGPPENVQIFEYAPRVGEDEQFKLFNYSYPTSRIPSETPPIGLGVGNLPLALEDLTFEISDEEHDSENYMVSSKPFSPLRVLISNASNEGQGFENLTLSSRASPKSSIQPDTSMTRGDLPAMSPWPSSSTLNTTTTTLATRERLRMAEEKCDALLRNVEKERVAAERLKREASAETNVSALSKRNGFDHDRSTRSEHHSWGSNGNCKVLHDQASDETITESPKFIRVGSGRHSPSQIQPCNDQNYSQHSVISCGAISRTPYRGHIMEELPKSLSKYGGNRQKYNVSTSCLDRSPASMGTQEMQPILVGAPRDHIFAEKAGSPRSKSNASTSTEHKRNIEEVRSETDSCSFPLGDAAEKQKSVYLSMSPGHTVFKKSASREAEVESPWRETQTGTSSLDPSRVKTVTGEEKAGEFHEESFLSALDELRISSTVCKQVSISAENALASNVKSEAKGAASVDFDHACNSTFGIGSWVENEPRHLRSLDVDGPHELCLWQTDFGMLEDLFAPAWQAKFRTCPGNPASGSGSQRGNFFEVGSHGSRQSPPNSSNSHRKHPSDGGDGPGEGDDPVQSKKAKTENETNRRFVCPFHVHDPTYFRTSMDNGQKYIQCAAGNGYADIARLKEHIKRVHSPEITCVRCGSAFKDQASLIIHLRHEEGPECPNLNLPAPRSMTFEMMTELFKRGKRESSCSEEDKWYKIYKLLFPNDSRPSTGPYWQDLSQPPTPSQEKQILVHMCEIDLPRLLGRRLDTKLGKILPDEESREQTKNMVISELVDCIKQLSLKPSETLNTFHESHVLGHKQYGGYSTDSAYGSRCGNIECMGNCETCEQLVSSMSQKSREHMQPMSSPVFDAMEQYFNPSLFPNPESNGNLQSTDNMDGLLDNKFPPLYGGHLYYNSSGF